MALTNQKQSPIPVVPRQMQIVNADGTPTRSGQLLLQQLQKTMVGYGAAGDLANATDVQDGMIFVVQGDNDEVLYQYQGGAWHYVAGTMWGTLSPDQRPVGLGANDAGFDFRSIDSDFNYGGREFIWSGTEWVEVTPNRYGTHANRLTMEIIGATWNGMLWAETDRSGVIYQLQSNAWHYLAGTMWNTLSPDTRPTDLGANDAGFIFRTTDTGSQYSGRTFVWSGTVWVETTAARFDSHANRTAATVANLINGMLWVETDRSEVIYQLQGSAWHFLSGTMWGTIVPDGRPTDLGANDAGFSYRGTDQVKQYIWSGTVWVDVTPQANTAQTALSTAALTLTTTPQNVPGASLSLSKAGTYLINGVFYLFLQGAGDANSGLLGNLSISQTNSAVLFSATAGIAATITQSWLVPISTVPTTVSLTAWKTGGSGSSVANNPHTCITALWVSP